MSACAGVISRGSVINPRTTKPPTPTTAMSRSRTSSASQPGTNWSSRLSAGRSAGVFAMRSRSLCEMEGQDLQLDRQVDLAERHVLGDLQRHRGEVEYRAQACRNQRVGDLLSGTRRRGYDCNIGAELRKRRGELRGPADQQAAAGRRADLVRVGIVDRDPRHPSIAEAAVAQQRADKANQTHNTDAALLGEPERLRDVSGERVDLVADAAGPELPEIAEVLADLRRVPARHLGDPDGADDGDAHGLRLVQAAQVDGQPLDRGLGYLVHVLSGHLRHLPVDEAA